MPGIRNCQERSQLMQNIPYQPRVTAVVNILDYPYERPRKMPKIASQTNFEDQHLEELLSSEILSNCASEEIGKDSNLFESSKVHSSFFPEEKPEKFILLPEPQCYVPINGIREQLGPRINIASLESDNLKMPYRAIFNRFIGPRAHL